MPNIIHYQALTATGFLRLPQVLQLIPVGKSTWWAGVASGRYPKSYKLGPRTTAWRCDDIHQLLAELSNGGAV
jgi:prophage regulatory protein